MELKSFLFASIKSLIARKYNLGQLIYFILFFLIFIIFIFLSYQTKRFLSFYIKYVSLIRIRCANVRHVYI